MRVAAVFTAYHPDERLAAAVEAALRSCTSVIVVDNTPAGADGSAPDSSAPALAGFSAAWGLFHDVMPKAALTPS